MNTPTARKCFEEIVQSFADIQRNLLIIGGTASGATSEQMTLADDLSETLQEVENEQLTSLRESFA